MSVELSLCQDKLEKVKAQRDDSTEFCEMRGTGKVSPAVFAHGTFHGVYFRYAYNNDLISHIRPGSKVKSFCFDVTDGHCAYLLMDGKIEKWNWFRNEKLHCVNVGIGLGDKNLLEQNDRYLLVSGGSNASIMILSKKNVHKCNNSDDDTSDDDTSDDDTSDDDPSDENENEPAITHFVGDDINVIIGGWFVGGTDTITIAGVDTDGNLCFRKWDHRQSGSKIIEQINVQSPHSKRTFSHELSRIFWSPFGNAFVIQEQKTEQGEPIDAWTTSVHAADGSIMKVLEETDDVNIAFNMKGSRMVSRDQSGKIKMYATTRYRYHYDDEFLEANCKQCSDITKNEEAMKYCIDPITLEPLRTHPPLYKTPIDEGGDGSCWNDAYADLDSRTGHPRTRGKWQPKLLDPPPREDKIEMMYEIVTEASRTDHVAVCGPEDSIMVIIPHQYGLVWCYDEAKEEIS